MVHFGLKAFLERHDLSAYQLAQAVEGLGEQTIFAYVRGSRTPSLKSLALVIQALRDLTDTPVDVADLLSYDESKPESAPANLEGLPSPSLIGPEGVIQERAPSLRLFPVAGASRYAFFLRNARDNTYLLENASSETPVYHPAASLTPGERYIWNARAYGAAGWSSFSSPLSFVIVTGTDVDDALVKLASPVPLDPFSETDSTTPTLSVAAGDAANWYGFYVRDLGADAIVYDNDYAARPSVSVPAGLLKPGGRYRWNARVRNAAGWSAFCERVHFSVSDTARATQPTPRPRPQGVVGQLQLSAEPQTFVITGRDFVPSSRVTLTNPSGDAHPVPPGLSAYKGAGALEVTATLGEAGTWGVQVRAPDGTQSALQTFTIEDQKI